MFDGITPLELVSVLRQSGVEVQESARPVTPRSELIELMGSQLILRACDEKNRCRPGFLRIVSFGMAKHYRGWNEQNHTAVMFSPMYNRLKRPMTFVGVAKAYIKRAVAEEWPEAISAFWKTIRGDLRKKDQPGASR